MKKVTLTINGVPRQVTVSPDKVLLDLLREDLRLTGTKQSCDRKGQCGACTVIVNSKAVRSCLRKVVDLDGASVITVEGLGTPENPHLIQEAFVLSGAIQCGYCTPGMIMSTKALLDQNNNPSVEEIKKALSGNWCRCTGYKKIIEAVQLASKFLRQETTPAKFRLGLGKKTLGVSHPRPTAMVKACGVAQFSADIKVDNALELAPVLSTEAHAKILKIDSAAALKMPGVVGIVTSEDIKGTNRFRGVNPDQPVLCEDTVRYFGDSIAVIAANTRDQARAAAAAVKIEYEKLPVLHDGLEAEKPGAVQLYKQWPNICYKRFTKKGDVDKALAEAAYVVEGIFNTQIVHQAAMEPEACVAYLEGEAKDEQVVVWGRSINIHFHAGALAEALGCKVRYKEPFVGGHFGIKASISSEGLTVAACLKFRQPVRFIPTIYESMLITTKKHPFTMNVKLSADKTGHLTGYYIDFLAHKGAYVGAPNGIHRCLYMLSSAYNIPNVFGIGRHTYCNINSGGAARGAGPPQTAFAMEQLIDMLAEKCGIDPLEFRLMNSLKPGQSKATGQVVNVWPFPEVCQAIKPHYDRALKDAAAFNEKGGTIRRGVGIGAHAFGVGLQGDQSHVAIEMDPDDGVTVYGAIADPGEGNDTMVVQVIAHVLDLPLAKVRLYVRDMDKTWPNGPAAGSRVTFVVGGALVQAAEMLKKALEEAGTRTYAGLKASGKPVRYEVTRTVPGQTSFDANGQGWGFDSEVQNVQMAEVEVDTATGKVKVLKMTTTVDCGTIINPQAFEGQLEGGMDQGVGFALREKYIAGKTRDLRDAGFPTINDSFEMEIIPIETPRPNGPLGATGIGEMTMISTAPAVVNAIYQACGARIYDLPATPEMVKAAIAAKK